MCVCVCVCVCVSVCLCVCVFVCVHAYVHVCVCAVHVCRYTSTVLAVYGVDAWPKLPFTCRLVASRQPLSGLGMHTNKVVIGSIYRCSS